MKSLNSIQFNSDMLDLNSVVGGAISGKTKRRSVSKNTSGETVDKCWHQDAKASY